MEQAKTVQGTDPRSGDKVGEPVPETTAAELAVLLARAADAAGPLGASAPQDRIALLHALADRLDAATAQLSDLAARESGLPLPRLTGEVARTSGQLRLFAQVVADGGYLEVIADSADDTAVPPRPRLRRWLEPVGPVLIFGASNFPFAFSVLGGDTASALASGCPVVVSKKSGVAELFDDTPAMRVVDCGAVAWAEALRQVAASAPLRDSMRRAALDYSRRQLAGWREVLDEDLFSLWREATQAPAELIA